MSKRFRRGLVVGKFCPLHLGHELLLRRARESCEELVVISYTKPGFEGYGSERRAHWLATRFPDVTSRVLDDERLALLCASLGATQREIPPDQAPDAVHRHFVAWLLADVFGTDVDAVFTSEHYGDGFADVLAARFAQPVEHVCVDMARNAVPVSGTRIRSDPYAWRSFMAPDVYASLVPRVALLGGESTGKSTLAQAIASALGTAWVPEYGRELWEARQGSLAFDDMVHIARAQTEREEMLAANARAALICDSTPLTTALYSQVLFGKLAKDLARLAERRYDLTFLCTPDFAFVQDGTRRDEAFRLFQHQWYVGALQARSTAYVPLTGSIEQRLACAVTVIREELVGI